MTSKFQRLQNEAVSFNQHWENFLPTIRRDDAELQESNTTSFCRHISTEKDLIDYIGSIATSAMKVGSECRVKILFTSELYIYKSTILSGSEYSSRIWFNAPADYFEILHKIQKGTVT